MPVVNLIPLSTPDHPANSSSAMLSTQTPGWQNSRDTAALVAAKNSNAFPLHSAMEHNPPVADVKVEALVENLVQFQNGGRDKIGKKWLVCGGDY
jgi:hypothetical protein